MRNLSFGFAHPLATRLDLKALVCEPAPGAAASAGAATAARAGVAAGRSAFIRRGIGRVH
ncbi:hypothetical protein [Sorangium sp. So ce388]|uniref:hypothetical protein n=1 Tax=Sorangium sp. So ce388 TaxID=3133309 RepID=UPI003F5B6BD0